MSCVYLVLTFLKKSSVLNVLTIVNIRLWYSNSSNTTVFEFKNFQGKFCPKICNSYFYQLLPWNLDTNQNKKYTKMTRPNKYFKIQNDAFQCLLDLLSSELKVLIEKISLIFGKTMLEKPVSRGRI